MVNSNYYAMVSPPGPRALWRASTRPVAACRSLASTPAPASTVQGVGLHRGAQGLLSTPEKHVATSLYLYSSSRALSWCLEAVRAKCPWWTRIAP